MKPTASSFDNVIITANIHYDSEEKCIKAAVLDSNGKETGEVLVSTPERLFEIYDPEFIMYIISGITFNAVLRRRKNSVWTDESDDSVPQYFYQVVSYNAQKAENEYKIRTARNFGYDQGYYAGVRDLGDNIKTFMSENEIVNADIITKIDEEIDKTWSDFSTAHPEVVDEGEP